MRTRVSNASDAIANTIAAATPASAPVRTMNVVFGAYGNRGTCAGATVVIVIAGSPSGPCGASSATTRDREAVTASAISAAA